MTLHFVVFGLDFDLAVTPPELAEVLKLVDWPPDGASVSEQKALAAKVTGLASQLTVAHQELTALGKPS